MPFRSEKQRRYLWATQPDIAKRWAHEYPQKKKLPMYANSKKKDKDQEEKAAGQTNLTQTDNFASLLWQISTKYKMKFANSIMKQIEMPQREEPTYAGQDEEEGKHITGETITPNGQQMPENCQNVTNNEQKNNDELTHPLLKKMAGVLSQRLRQALAGQDAYAPNNVNLSLHQQQPPAPTIPPPMGMAAAPGQPPQAAPAPVPQPTQAAQPSPSIMDPSQPPKMASYAPQLAQNFPDLPKGVSRTTPMTFQQKQEVAKAQEQKNRYKPVGNSNSPNANPINSYGAIGNGSIGNSAFGTRNNIMKSSQARSQLIKRALSPDAESAIVHGTGLVGSGAIGGALGVLPSYGLKAVMNSAGLIPDATKHPIGNFAGSMVANLPTFAGTTAGMMLYDKYIMQPMREREEKKRQQDAQSKLIQSLLAGEQFPAQKKANTSLDRVLATALVSAGGGLALGAYPGLKLQQASEAAGNPALVNFTAGKAPIVMGSALSAGLYNYLQDRPAAQPKRKAKPKAAEKAYLKYLVH